MDDCEIGEETDEEEQLGFGSRESGEDVFHAEIDLKKLIAYSF